MILRPRQEQFVAQSMNALERYNNTVSVAPTGSGKTICFSSLIKKLMRDNFKVLVLAHRDELNSQNQDKFSQVAPNISTSVIDVNRKDWSGQVVFAMVQTLTREEHLQNMPIVDLLVIDEAHHAITDSYTKIIKHAKGLNTDLKLFGVTATPIRSDKSSLGTVFNNCADQIEIHELIASGHLVPPVTYRIDTGETQEKLQALKAKASGDYSDQEMADIMNTIPLNSSVVKEWKERASERKTVVFCSNKKHAEEVTREFKKQGVRASFVTGDMPLKERQQRLDDLTSGKLQVIVNVAILVEGWDYPPISCVILLRSSSYKSTMIQMIGRGLRTINPKLYPDVVKLDCLVLDFGISTILHGNLEQSIDLRTERKGQRKCPDCRSPIPRNSELCPLCNVDIEEQIEKKKASKKLRVLENFTMREINLLEKLTFAWTDLELDNKAMIATGFNSWCCVLKNNDIWISVGGGKRGSQLSIETELIHQGEKLQALAAGNDFLYRHETYESATKAGAWRQEKATESQKKWLMSHFKGKKLSKGEASAVITYNLQASRKISNLIEQRI